MKYIIAIFALVIFQGALSRGSTSKSTKILNCVGINNNISMAPKNTLPPNDYISCETNTATVYSCSQENSKPEQLCYSALQCQGKSDGKGEPIAFTQQVICPAQSHGSKTLLCPSSNDCRILSNKTASQMKFYVISRRITGSPVNVFRKVSTLMTVDDFSKASISAHIGKIKFLVPRSASTEKVTPQMGNQYKIQINTREFVASLNLEKNHNSWIRKSHRPPGKPSKTP